jgi:hypothetical protein
MKFVNQLRQGSIVKKLLFCAFLIFCYSQAQAATRAMTACTQAAFTTAYNAALSGDLIAFPAGSCTITWSGTTNIAKTNLTIQGQGVGVTILNNGMFSVTGSSGNGLRITGIDFRGPGGSNGFVFQAIPNAGQVVQNIRLDHNRFYNYGVVTQWGYSESTSTTVPNNCVVDHNQFDRPTYSTNYVWGPCTDTTNFPFTLGTAYGVYFEDNEIIDPSGAMVHFITSRCASRYVIRHNNFSSLLAWDPIDMHDSYEGGGRSNAKRGSWTAEIYGNKFTYTGTGKRIINFRGGQAVIYNNYYNNSQTSGGINLQSYNIEEGICTHGQIIASDGRYCDAVNRTYIWGNKYNCGTDMTNCASGTSVTSINTDGNIILNTDYWMSQMSGYTPLQYPHPLTTTVSSQPPLSPTNFRLIPQ